ncbi:hypothetical protein MTO96_022368 [Rhipicephalus appendiculatus]
MPEAGRTDQTERNTRGSSPGGFKRANRAGGFREHGEHDHDEAPARGEPKSSPLPMKSTQHNTTNTRARSRCARRNHTRNAHPRSLSHAQASLHTHTVARPREHDANCTVARRKCGERQAALGLATVLGSAGATLAVDELPARTVEQGASSRRRRHRRRRS